MKERVVEITAKRYKNDINNIIAISPVTDELKEYEKWTQEMKIKEEETQRKEKEFERKIRRVNWKTYLVWCIITLFLMVYFVVTGQLFNIYALPIIIAPAVYFFIREERIHRFELFYKHDLTPRPSFIDILIESYQQHKEEKRKKR